MRENKYVTMMDPFQQKYGNVLSSALIFPALVADVLWVARTLVSLGKLPHTVKLSGIILYERVYLSNHAGTNSSRYTICTNTRVEKQLEWRYLLFLAPTHSCVVNKKQVQNK